jgi:two-component system sensor kinase FixL
VTPSEAARPGPPGVTAEAGSAAAVSERSWMAGSVRLVGWGLAGALLVSLASGPLSGRAPEPRASIVLLLGLLLGSGALLLNRLGDSRRAAQILALGLPILAAALMAVTGRGVRDPAVLMMPASLVLCGILLDRGTLAATTTLTVAGTAGLLLAEAQGLLGGPQTRIDAADDVLDSLLILVMTGVGVGIVAGRLRRDLDRMRAQGAALRTSEERYRSAAAELQRSLARWRSLVEEAPVVVVSTAADGVVEFVNLPETLAAPLRGRSLTSVLEDPAAAQALAYTSATGHASIFEVESASLSQTGRASYLVHAGSVREADRHAGLTLVLIDVSEAKRAREERESLIAELERRNAELERFTYTVSHDLRAPLVTVNGFMGMLERDIARNDLTRVPGDIRRVRSAVDTMDGLLSQLLELSRVGRIVTPPEPVPFGELVREAAQLVSAKLEAGRVRLEIAPDLPTVSGDRVRLREVVQNLLENAAKFMGGQETPLVEVSWRRDGDTPVICVRDNGIGVAKKYQEKIFGLFERLDTSLDGMGIGLALVKRIVEVHGGSVWVESEGPGHGSLFCLGLPGVAPAPQGEPKPR